VPASLAMAGRPFSPAKNFTTETPRSLRFYEISTLRTLPALLNAKLFIRCVSAVNPPVSYELPALFTTCPFSVSTSWVEIRVHFLSFGQPRNGSLALLLRGKRNVGKFINKSYLGCVSYFWTSRSLVASEKVLV